MGTSLDRAAVRATRGTRAGWGTLVVVAVVMGLVGYRWIAAEQAFDEQGHAAIREWVLLELQRDYLSREDPSRAERANALITLDAIVVTAVEVRGSADQAVARVELAANEAFPEGTALVRYYRIRRTPAGWMVMGDTTATAFYLAFL